MPNPSVKRIASGAYANERFLYRLSLARHKDSFILNGVVLFAGWDGSPRRWGTGVKSAGTLPQRYLINSRGYNSAMPKERPWQDELKVVVDLMRDLSLQTDPQAAAEMYGKRMRSDGLVPGDAFLSISRRKLKRPQYRITRNSQWKEEINPWAEPQRLPLFDSGLLGELIYSNEPAVINDLPARLRADDPAAEYLRGYEMLVALPHYDGGESLNMSCILGCDAKSFPIETVPLMVWLANLWGRAVNNLVLRKELEVAFEELKAAHLALDREMATVGQVQRSLLPVSPPLLPGLDFSVHYETSQRAGGDYYDFFKCPDGRLGIIVADVSGHGAPAAVLMAVTQALAQLHPGAGDSPSDLLAFLNRHLTERYTNRTASFVTAFYAMFDPGTLTIAYASAGHPAPRIVRCGSILTCSGKSGLPLGIQSGEDYQQSTMQLEHGDTLVIFTDGITESRNADHDMFGFERLDAALAKSPGRAGVMQQAILATLEAFCGNRSPDDDRTLVLMSI